MENETAGIVRVPYASVNGAWPEGPLPVPTGPEALRGCRLLVREGFRFHGMMHEVKRKRKFKLTSGNRRTWPSGGVWKVNPNEGPRGGWREMVHEVSHYIHWRANPGLKPHQAHAMTEKHLIEYVVTQGWLDGVLKLAEPEPKPPVDPRVRLLQRRTKWVSKMKRAETAMRKLNKQLAYYDRKFGNVL